MSLSPLTETPRSLPSMRIGTFIGFLHLVVSILGAGIITAFSLYFIYQSGVQASLREMEDLAFITVNALNAPVSNFDLASGASAEIDATLKRYLGSRPDLRFTILSPDGTPYLRDSSTCALVGIALTSPEVVDALSKTIGHSIRPCPDGERTIYVATAINSHGHLAGILVLAAPFDQMMTSTYSTMRWLGVIALLIVAFTVFEGWVGSVYISKPLARLSRVAEQLSRGDMTARAEERGPVEVIHLARTLNVMAGRVQNSLESMRAFVANASHELRTPLTSIKLQVGALTEGACDEPEVAERFLGQVNNEIDRLSRMVSDMLDLSQIEAGGPGIEMRTVDLAELAQEVRAFWESRSRQAGLELNVTSETGLSTIHGDPYRLRQLFDNLLDNAIKYTPAGGCVDIRLRRLPPDASTRRVESVRVEVRDTGAGIAPEHLARIFDRFYRIEMRRIEMRRAQQNANTVKPEGSGLGLAIAQSIVKIHGGEIGVESRLGEGSLFWVELPV